MPPATTLPPGGPGPAYAAPLGAGEVRTVRPLCWGAVLAGAFAALSIHLLVTLLGIGLGLQVIQPATDAEPVEKFSVGVGIAWSFAALLALWFGGWVAGRLTPESNRGLGGIHGFLVWSVATVTVAFAFTSGASMLIGGVANIVGKSAGATAQIAGAGGQTLGQFAASNSNVLESYANEFVPAQDGGAPDPRAMREVSWALIRYFSTEERQGQAREALVGTIAQNTTMDRAEVDRRVEAMSASYDRIQQDIAALGERAAVEAREAAETASNYVTHAAVWTFIAFVIGAVSATWGGAMGARSRQEHDVGGGAGVRADDPDARPLGTPRHA
jgi:hypothetical protein